MFTTLLILICRNVKRAMTVIHFWEGLQCIFYDIYFNKDTEYWKWFRPIKSQVTLS